jgi:TM2 domain-containing membrane protein YozV
MDSEAFDMKCYAHPDVDAIGTCTNCGKAVCPACSMEVGGKLVCKHCAEIMATQCVTAQAMPMKEPALALLLSLVGGLVSGLAIGLGQVYNGQIKKGIILSVLNVSIWAIIVAAYVIVTVLTLGFGAFCLPVLCLPMLISPLLWLYAMYDAYMIADRMNKGEPVKDWLD